MSQLLLSIGIAALGLVIGGPLLGWPPVVRLSAVLIPVLVAGVCAARPWRYTREDWDRIDGSVPSGLAIALGAIAVGGLVLWVVLTRFQSGGINGVDFTVYFDRPLFQTSIGRPLFVETTDQPAYAQLSHLAAHAYWLLLPLSFLYMLHATPMWLLVLSVVAVVAGAVHVLRIGQKLRFGSPLAAGTALAFVFNDNTARTLNYGFHPEVLYAWFVPWMIDAGLSGNRRSFLAAATAAVLVKEDAILPIVGATVAIGLLRWRHLTATDRLLFLAAPNALALANLAFYYGVVVPALAPGGTVMYAHFWANYGETPLMAGASMIAQPGRVLRDMWTSGLVDVAAPPHLFLQIIGWKWSIGTLPMAALFGASASQELRGFGLYYSILLVPFYSIGASSGALALVGRFTPHRGARALAAAAIVAGALLVGGGYSLRPWKPEIAAVPGALQRLRDEQKILVQSGLYPHAGYDARIQLLTPDALRDRANAGAAVLLAPRISAYPFPEEQFARLMRMRRIAEMDDGLRAVRLRHPSRRYRGKGGRCC